jgi:hypothetical protein
MIEKTSTQHDTKGIFIDEVTKLWEQPASRSRLRDLVASSRSLRDLLIQASDPAKFKRHGGKVQRERPVIHPDF